MQYRSYRYPCDHPVTVHSSRGREAAVVINVSEAGARLGRIGPLGEGDPVRVELISGDKPRLAEVRWSRGGQLGLRFARPLDPRELAVIRKTAVNPLADPWVKNYKLLRELR